MILLSHTSDATFGKMEFFCAKVNMESTVFAKVKINQQKMKPEETVIVRLNMEEASTGCQWHCENVHILVLNMQVHSLLAPTAHVAILQVSFAAN